MNSRRRDDITSQVLFLLTAGFCIAFFSQFSSIVDFIFSQRPVSAGTLGAESSFVSEAESSVNFLSRVKYEAEPFPAISLLTGTETQHSYVHPRVALLFFQPVPINQSEADVLAALPGIGPVLANRIIERRNVTGCFTELDNLLKIEGIGRKKLAALASFLAVDSELGCLDSP